MLEIFFVRDLDCRSSLEGVVANTVSTNDSGIDAKARRMVDVLGWKHRG